MSEQTKLQRWLCVVYAPSCPEDAESYAETYARPVDAHKYLFKEPADV
jgi:hypothetical protein